MKHLLRAVLILGIVNIASGISGFDAQGLSSADRTALTIGALLTAIGWIYRRE